MGPVSSKARAGAGAAGSHLDRIRALAPMIEAAGDDIERQRRIPPEVLDGLHEAGLFRMLLPRPFGGGEVSPPEFVQTIEAAAKLDGSLAWCLCQGNGCAMTAAYLDPAAAEEIWGRDPRAVVAWGPGARSQAVIEGDGYRVTGNWAFASGIRHATWLGGHCSVVEADGQVRRLPDGSPAIRTVLFPKAEAALTDIWDVIGLRGTASDAFAVKDLFVPRAYSAARDEPAERRYEAPLYQFPAMSLYAMGFSGVALGIARAMLEAFMDLALEKTPRLQKSPLKDNAVVQAEVAQAEARLSAARGFLLDTAAAVWDAVVASGELTVAQRMRIRLAATFGIHEAKAAADTVYDAAGASAIFASTPFERRMRDIHTVTQQLQGRKSHFQTVGAYLLGHPADMSVI